MGVLIHAARMRPPRPVPAHLARRAFSRKEALEAGITPRMLQHRRFVEVYPSVYRLEGVELDERGQIDAARRALPQDARVSHGTRLRMLGAERGPFLPLHFTVARDLHLDLPGVMLHRTVVMPPHDESAVSVESAYLGLAASARPLDLIVLGDWLLHRKHMSLGVLLALAHSQSWRPGAAEVVEIAPRLTCRARSMPESETRAFLELSGLPTPEINHDVLADDGTFLGCGDLVFLLWRLLVEYEGGQHWTDADQIASDADRYGRLRRADWDYVQVTAKHLRHPKAVVRTVHRALVARGYEGPAPEFGDSWEWLLRGRRQTRAQRAA